MKKTVLVLVVLLIFGSLNWNQPESKKRKNSFTCLLTKIEVKEVNFIVTAYYSPLKNQKEYVMDSYEEEIIFQGEGKQAADGTKPYWGMLAADWSRYPPKTKIFVPGYTDKICGQKSPIAFSVVHDTGGRIKENHLDVWMGKGDKGRERAQRWGVKILKCQVVAKISQQKLTIKY